MKWKPHLFSQPRIIKIIPCSSNKSRVPILIIHAPSRIRTFRKIYETLSLSWKISIMIYGKDIAIIVKIEVLAVTKAIGKNLELTSVWVATQDAAGMRVANSLPFFCQDIQTTISHAPIELAVIALNDAVEVMIPISNMGSEAMSNVLSAVRNPITICIGQLPKVGNNCSVDVSANRRNAVGYPSQNLVETLSKEGCLIKYSIGVLILQCVDLFAAHR